MDARTRRLAEGPAVALLERHALGARQVRQLVAAARRPYP